MLSYRHSSTWILKKLNYLNWTTKRSNWIKVVTLSLLFDIIYRQICAVALHQISESVQQNSTLRRVHRSPCRIKSESFFCSLHSIFNVTCIAFLHLGNDFFRRGIQRGKCFSRLWFEPLVVDKYLEKRSRLLSAGNLFFWAFIMHY